MAIDDAVPQSTCLRQHVIGKVARRADLGAHELSVVARCLDRCSGRKRRAAELPAAVNDAGKLQVGHRTCMDRARVRLRLLDDVVDDLLICLGRTGQLPADRLQVSITRLRQLP